MAFKLKMVFTFLKGCKEKKKKGRRMCNTAPKKSKTLVIWPFTEKFADPHLAHCK